MLFLLIALVSLAFIFCAAYLFPVWTKTPAPDLSKPLDRIELDTRGARSIFLPGRGRYPGLSGNSHQRRVARRKLTRFFDGTLS